MAIYPYREASPSIAQGAFVAPSADVIGRVTIAEDASVWFGAVLRGDGEALAVGRGSNIQDGAVCHADPGFPLQIGEGVTVGHRAVVHGARVGDGALVGMGATLLNGSVLGEGAILAAGAVLPEGREIPPKTLAAGVPARVVRALTPEEEGRLRLSAEHYAALAQEYRRFLAGNPGRE